MRWSSGARWRLGKAWWLFSSSQVISFLNHKPGFSLEIRMSSLRKSKYQTWFNGFCVLQITEGKGAQSFYTCVTLDICPFLPVLQMHLLIPEWRLGERDRVSHKVQFSSNIECNEIEESNFLHLYNFEIFIIRYLIFLLLLNMLLLLNSIFWFLYNICAL